jgi:nucleotide-binding universal stress UspA family protein
MKILLAVDGSACSDLAVEEVVRRPWPDDSEILVLSAVEPPSLAALPDSWGPPSDFYERLEKAAGEQASAAADRAGAALRGTQGQRLRVTSQVVEGFPKEVILREAERWGADLIVVGSHGYRGLTRLWLGSVSHAVASHAKCSVMIVRGREKT